MKSVRTAVQARPFAAGAGARPALAVLDGGDHVYRVIEVVGTSSKSISDAIDRTIARAHKTLRNLRWFDAHLRPHRKRQSAPLPGDAVGVL